MASVTLNLRPFCSFFRDPQKRQFLPKNFPGRICSAVDILMLDIGYGRESDSENEEKCRSHCRSITEAITQGVDVIVVE